jgi:hypothetical protein
MALVTVGAAEAPAPSPLARRCWQWRGAVVEAALLARSLLALQPALGATPQALDNALEALAAHRVPAALPLVPPPVQALLALDLLFLRAQARAGVGARGARCALRP